jgi:hypothetical protein
MLVDRGLRTLLVLGLRLLGGACASPPTGEADDRAKDPVLGRIDELGGVTTGRPERLLWVSISGLGADAVRPGMPGSVAVAAQLAAAGVVAERVEGAAPPSVYPAHATLVTGQSPREHGVVADHLIGERGIRPELYWHVSHLRVPALWQVARERGLSVAALDWPTTQGSGLPDLLPDALATRRGESWPEVVADEASPWLLEAARAAGPAAGVPGAARDAFLVDSACTLYQKRPPVLLLLRLSQAVPVAVVHGPGSEAAHDALLGAGAELERLLRCVDAQGWLPGSTVVVTGDRTLVPVHTAVHPNTLLAEAGLIATEGDRVASWSAYARGNGGSALVYASDETSAREARRVLGGAAAATGAFRIVPAEVLIAVGADPEAWFGIEARPGWVLRPGVGTPLLAPARARGADPGFVDPASAGPAFLAWGVGVRRGLRLPLVAQTDIAPTVASLLGVPFGEGRGRALVGILDLSPPGTSPP